MAQPFGVPLAGGLLTAKYNESIPEGTRATLPGYEWFREEIDSEEVKGYIEKVKQLMSIAKGLSCSMAQLALAWCLKNPNVSSVITGASKPEQVIENMNSLDIVEKLTDEIIDQIENILKNKPKAETDSR